jgi:cysteine desulfurase
VPGVRVNAGDADRLWNTTNLALPGLDAEAMVLALSERGVAASAGAACASGSLEPSVVLTAMGLPESVVVGSVRLSTSRCSTDTDRRRAVEALADAASALVNQSRHAVE